MNENNEMKNVAKIIIRVSLNFQSGGYVRKADPGNGLICLSLSCKIYRIVFSINLINITFQTSNKYTLCVYFKISTII